MNHYVTANTLKMLREEKKLTQVELANLLFVSPKTISKWETGKGLPDVSILEDIARILNVSISELFTGSRVINKNTHGNMLNSKVYVCPICGNAIFSIGECVINCHGINLYPLEAEDGEVDVENVEDEIFVSIESPMNKNDYISFIAGVSSDNIDIKKLYPEGPAEARFKTRDLKQIYYYNNRNGLFKCKLKSN